MKHTKNILKSLLITVMALSLLSVSCSKDEGGTKNPVNPDTPITIDAKTINSVLTFNNLEVGEEKVTISTTSPDVSTSTKITVSAKAAQGKNNIAKADFKTGIEQIISNLNISGATVARNGEIDTSVSGKAPMSVKLDIAPSGQNKFDAALTTVKDGKLSITLEITPDKVWN